MGNNADESTQSKIKICSQYFLTNQTQHSSSVPVLMHRIKGVDICRHLVLGHRYIWTKGTSKIMAKAANSEQSRNAWINKGT